MNTIRNFKQKKTMNNILYKTVDKDVQSMLLPLNLMQHIIFCPKYRIKHDVITPNSFKSNLASMTTTLVFIFAFAYRTYMLTFYQEFIGNKSFMYVTSTYDTVYYCSGLIINFITGIIQTKNSVKFVLTFQRVHRFLNNEVSFNHFVVWNWIILSLALCGHLSVFTIICIIIDIPYVSMFICFLVITFDFNVLYTIRIIQLLENKFVLWSKHVLNYRLNAYGEDCKNVFQVYVDLLECYNIHKHCFQQFVSILQFII